MPQKDQGFKRHFGEKKKEEPPPQIAPVIPITHAAAPAEPAKKAGPLPFSGLFSLLSEQRISIWRWLGRKAYGAAAREQKKNGKCRKGTLLDEKAG